MSAATDLIYDVGLHRGEDTAFYLAKGYRVVAFEAHPDHVAWCRSRFANAIEDGRLRIVEGAVTDTQDETVTFFIHPRNSEWGTIAPSWAERNAVNPAMSARSREVTVPAVNFSDVLAETGVPVFMKVDIEGADRLCFEALRLCPSRPHYVSLESSKTSVRETDEEVNLLLGLGYSRFSLVQQATLGGTVIHTRTRDGAPLTYELEATSSGDFGEGLHGWTSPARIRGRQRAIRAAHWLVGDVGVLRRAHIGHRAISKFAGYVPFAVPGWWDIHAALAPDLR